MDEEKVVEETAGQEAQKEVKSEAAGAVEAKTVAEVAKKLVGELPEHTTVQRVANGFVISVPGQKHRVAYTLEEVIKHVTEIFTV